MDVRTLCLGILTLGDSSGYDIRKQFEEGPFAYFHHAGFGSIYPALKALNREGLVDCFEMSQRGRPGKKVYSITAKGLEAFRNRLAKKPARDKNRSEIMVMLFFAHLLDEDHLREVFEGYLGGCRKAAEHIKSLDPAGIPPNCQFTSGFGQALYEAAVRYMEDNRHLLFDKEGNDQRKAGMER